MQYIFIKEAYFPSFNDLFRLQDMLFLIFHFKTTRLHAVTLPLDDKIFICGGLL